MSLKQFLIVIFSCGIYLPQAMQNQSKYLLSAIYFMGKEFIYEPNSRLTVNFCIFFFLNILSIIFSYWLISFLLLPSTLYCWIKLYINSSQYRYKNFSFTAKLKNFYKVFLLYFLLVVLSCGLLLPWFCKQTNEVIFNNVYYSDKKGLVHIKLKDLYRSFYYLILIFLALFFIVFVTYLIMSYLFPNYKKIVELILFYPYLIVSLPLLLFCFLVRQWNYAWDNFNLGGQIFFERNLSFGKSLYFLFSFVFCSIISLGILYPFMKYRLTKYLTSTFKVYFKGNLNKIFNS